MKRAIIAAIPVCIAQAVFAWFCFRIRAVTHSPWADSDLTVFVLPFILGFCCFAFILFQSAWPKRGVRTLGVGALLALCSSLVGTVVGFNLYGT
jgi:hypothetical protein